MSFEEDFKALNAIIEFPEGNRGRVLKIVIEKYCLDKQKVKEAIEKVRTADLDYTKETFSERLLKELNLE